MNRRVASVEALVAEFAGATDRLHRLVTGLDAGVWSSRPATGGWSVAECVEHLNVTARAYAPLLRSRLDSAPATETSGSRPFRRDVTGWLLCRALEPPARMRARTPPPFEPEGVGSMADTVAAFEGLQRMLVGLLRDAAARGVPLDRLKVASPFNGRVKYSVWSAFRVLAAHQRRHLWQAERVRQALSR
ncbi:MAG: DinB family protein [Vicinamibacteraceae bacterium]|nr:DinB family protein [Vicinamibacteraceae bacterium]MCL4846200.1 DinB family protein [Acidobacteriota bacterium]